MRPLSGSRAVPPRPWCGLEDQPREQSSLPSSRQRSRACSAASKLRPDELFGSRLFLTNSHLEAPRAPTIETEFERRANRTSEYYWAEIPKYPAANTTQELLGITS
eukprot:5836919-Pleurochrysis_carterae.AAC.1